MINAKLHWKYIACTFSLVSNLLKVGLANIATKAKGDCPPVEIAWYNPIFRLHVKSPWPSGRQLGSNAAVLCRFFDNSFVPHCCAVCITDSCRWGDYNKDSFANYVVNFSRPIDLHGRFILYSVLVKTSHRTIFIERYMKFNIHNSEDTRKIVLFDFSVNVFTDKNKISDKNKIAVFEPAISCVRNQYSTSVPGRHR